MGIKLIGEDRDSKSVSDDQIEQAQRNPCGSPVMTRDDDRSSTMSGSRNGVESKLCVFVEPRLDILCGGNSPLFLFSLKRARCSSEILLGRMLQLKRGICC